MTDDYSEQCHDFIFNKLLKKWAEFGIDHEYGYSAESLTKKWQLNPVGRIRLLTQCRQLYTFSHAYLLTKETKWLSILSPLYKFIIDYYAIEIEGNNSNQNELRWRFSLDEQLQPQDNTTDAYAMAFILLSFSFYYRATNDGTALTYIKKTDNFLNTHMTAKNGGFYEAYPINTETLRRQNPHMHLLEGYIAAFDATHNPHYKTQIIKLLQLAKDRFYEPKSRSLLEFFDNDWQPDTKIGNQTEPGHHFEWVWLLHQAYRIHQDQDYLKIAEQLWDKACHYGFDSQGGIYNQIDAYSGSCIDQEKRIWPITEYLKAACVHLENTPSKTIKINQTLKFVFNKYLQNDGGWNEYLDKNNLPKNYPLPGTTSYHIFLGLTEVLDWQNTIS